jgi:hypothetical protein
MSLILRFTPLLALGLMAGCADEGRTAPSAAAPQAAAPIVEPATGDAPATDAAPAPGQPPANAGPAPEAQARAQAALRDFSERLRGELRAAMTADGAPAAVDFCHDQAPRIAEQVMAEHGVRLGRVAVPGRHRNPGHVAEGWQAEVLASFQSAVDRGGAPEAQLAVVRDGLPADVELRMARGLRVEAACLMCHGASIAPGIAARIEQNYPDDHATGFREGDLRGLAWVEVPKPVEPSP